MYKHDTQLKRQNNRRENGWKSYSCTLGEQLLGDNKRRGWFQKRPRSSFPHEGNGRKETLLCLLYQGHGEEDQRACLVPSNEEDDAPMILNGKLSTSARWIPTLSLFFLLPIRPLFNRIHCSRKPFCFPCCYDRLVHSFFHINNTILLAPYRCLSLRITPDGRNVNWLGKQKRIFSLLKYLCSIWTRVCSSEGLEDIQNFG